MAKEKTPRTTIRSKKTGNEIQLAPEAVTPEVEVKEPEAKKTAPKKTAAKKPETKAFVIPINAEEEIRRRAYELSEQRGFVPGYEAEDWLAAEQEILARYQVRTA